MSVKRPAENATKARILEAFDDLGNEYESLEQQVQQLQKELKSAQTAPKTAPEPATKATPAPISAPTLEVKPVKAFPQSDGQKSDGQNKMESTLKLLEQLQSGISSTLAELSEKLSVEAGKLEDLSETTQLERTELGELYELTLADDSLDKLLSEYEATAKTSKEAFSTRKEALEAKLLELRRAWELEQESQAKAIQDRNLLSSTTQKREAEEYKYALELSRKLGEEQYQASQLELNKARIDRKEVQDKEWAEAEKLLAEREKNQLEASTKVEGIKAEKEAAIKKAEAEGMGIGNKQARVKADLLGKEIEGQNRIFVQRISGLQARVDIQQNRIAALSKQLETASRQMQELAAKAIEGSANSSSLQAFKDLAMEQAKSQSKTKS